MRPRSVFCAGAIALLALTGCGSGHKGRPIPSGQASQMLALIQVADSEARNGSCSGAADKARGAANVAAALPRSVDKDVRRGLIDGIARLEDLIASQCQRPQKQQPSSETTTTPSTTTPSTTTPTTPTQTNTETNTTTSQTTTTQTQTNTGTGTTPTGTGNGGVPPPTGTGGNDQ
ncbi:MAG: hypothetical protein ACJ76Z_00200 [Thermoleophilaceae bacterium]